MAMKDLANYLPKLKMSVMHVTFFSYIGEQFETGVILYTPLLK